MGIFGEVEAGVEASRNGATPWRCNGSHICMARNGRVSSGPREAMS